jgi:hypothetical protein
MELRQIEGEGANGTIAQQGNSDKHTDLLPLAEGNTLPVPYRVWFPLLQDTADSQSRANLTPRAYSCDPLLHYWTLDLKLPCSYCRATGYSQTAITYALSSVRY